MEQIVVAGRRAIGVGGLAVLPAVLIKAQVNKIFIGKYSEQQIICHKKPPSGMWGAIQNGFQNYYIPKC